MLVAGAILAFAAPAAFTANAMIPRDETSAVSTKRTQPVLTLVKARERIASQTATIKALNAKVKTLTAANKSLKAQSTSQWDTIRALQDQIWNLTHPLPIEVTPVLPDPDSDC